MMKMNAEEEEELIEKSRVEYRNALEVIAKRVCKKHHMSMKHFTDLTNNEQKNEDPDKREQAALDMWEDLTGKAMEKVEKKYGVEIEHDEQSIFITVLEKVK